MARIRRRDGFTLVELLVVIGIIAVVMAILLPSLSRARETAKRIKCLSNMRQLGAAVMAYTVDNEGHFPRLGSWHPQGQPGSYTGLLLKYHGKAGVPELYNCPADDPQTHSYPYCYTANWHIFWYSTTTSIRSMSQIKRSSDKIMIIDESSQTVDDDCWAPENWTNDRQNMLSNRHDKQQEKAREANAEETLKGGRGNVIFADGHADFVPRRLAMSPESVEPLKP